MNRIASGLAVCAAVACLAGSAAAQPTIDFHKSVQIFSCGDVPLDGAFGCGDLNTNGTGAGFTQVLVVFGGIGAEGISAVQFGIDHSSTGSTNLFGEGSGTFGTCTPDYQVISLDGPNGGWPLSGAGAAIALQGCVEPTNAGGLVPIVFLLSNAGAASGTMTIIPDPQEGIVAYADCAAATSPILNTGVYDFGGGTGTTACTGPVPTENRTWGQIKALF